MIKHSCGCESHKEGVSICDFHREQMIMFEVHEKACKNIDSIVSKFIWRTLVADMLVAFLAFFVGWSMKP